jgi:hypothetical protein
MHYANVRLLRLQDLPFLLYTFHLPTEAPRSEQVYPLPSVRYALSQ